MSGHATMRARVVVWLTALAVAWVASHFVFPAPMGAFDMDASGRGRLFWAAFLVLAGWDLARHYRNPDRRRTPVAPTGPSVRVAPGPATEPTVRVEAPQ